MKIILLKQKRGLGKIGEIVTVKDGYGRNYLIPNGIAVRATAENQAMIASKKSEFEQHNIELQKNAESVNTKISGKDFTFIRQAGDDGRLFGSVSAKDIADKLSENISFPLIHSNIILQHPIKSLGIHEIQISLHAEVNSRVLINVARSESEAKDALGSFKEASKAAENASDNDAA